ncbi:hypothetical protein HK101_003961, partial [Irineochytrium annulatum]
SPRRNGVGAVGAAKNSDIVLPSPTTPLSPIREIPTEEGTNHPARTPAPPHAAAASAEPGSPPISRRNPSQSVGGFKSPPTAARQGPQQRVNAYLHTTPPRTTSRPAGSAHRSLEPSHDDDDIEEDDCGSLPGSVVRSYHPALPGNNGAPTYSEVLKMDPPDEDSHEDGREAGERDHDHSPHDDEHHDTSSGSSSDTAAHHSIAGGSHNRIPLRRSPGVRRASGVVVGAQSAPLPVKRRASPETPDRSTGRTGMTATANGHDGNPGRGSADDASSSSSGGGGGGRRDNVSPQKKSKRANLGTTSPTPPAVVSGGASPPRHRASSVRSVSSSSSIPTSTGPNSANSGGGAGRHSRHATMGATMGKARGQKARQSLESVKHTSPKGGKDAAGNAEMDGCVDGEVPMAAAAVGAGGSMRAKRPALPIPMGVKGDAAPATGNQSSAAADRRDYFESWAVGCDPSLNLNFHHGSMTFGAGSSLSAVATDTDPDAILPVARKDANSALATTVGPSSMSDEDMPRAVQVAMSAVDAVWDTGVSVTARCVSTLTFGLARAPSRWLVKGVDSVSRMAVPLAAAVWLYTYPRREEEKKKEVEASTE